MVTENEHLSEFLHSFKLILITCFRFEEITDMN
jgi:hypothetical protein